MAFQSSLQLNPLRPPWSFSSSAATKLSFSGGLDKFPSFRRLLHFLLTSAAILTCQCVYVGCDTHTGNVPNLQIGTNEYGVTTNYNYANITITTTSDVSDSRSDRNEDLDPKSVSRMLTDVLIKVKATATTPSSLPLTDSPASSRHQTESFSTSPSSSSTLTSTSPSQIRSTVSPDFEAPDLAQLLRDPTVGVEGRFPQKRQEADAKPDVDSRTKDTTVNDNDNDTNGLANANKTKRHADRIPNSHHKSYGMCGKAMRMCLDQMPRSPINGIPTTVQELNNSCRAFENGVGCFNNVSASCLEDGHRRHIIMRLHAEFDILQSMCYNDSFRFSCLSNGERDCYTEIADRWNKCAQMHAGPVNRLRNENKVDELCCIETTFTECVTTDKSKSKAKNGFNTTQYLESMSKAFVQLLQREHLHIKLVKKCASVKTEACVLMLHNDNSTKNDHALNDDTNAAADAAPQNKRNSVQVHYLYEFDDEDDDDDEDGDHDDNDGHHHHHYHDGKNEDPKHISMTKLSSAKNAAGSDGKSTTTGGKKKLNKCSEDLQRCMNQIPPMPDAGIPSTLQGVKNACRAFHNGTECVSKVAKNCLSEKERLQIHNSILGAHETFTFLCSDDVFRTNYLQHSGCYNKISKHWDNCVKKFILALKQMKDVENSMELCCLRVAFLRCVTDITKHYCDQNATQFMRLLTETLIRTTLHGHTPKQCVTVKAEQCPLNLNSAGRIGHGYREGSKHRLVWILGRVVLSLTMMDLLTFYYTRFIIT